MFKTLPTYPLLCPDCSLPSPTWRCINFWDAVWKCSVCNHVRPVDEDSLAYRALPPAFVADFPYPKIEDDRHD